MAKNDNIPKEIAQQLCNEIYGKYKGKWMTLAAWQCWGCNKFGKDNKCFDHPSDYRGCNLINKRYDRNVSSK